MWHRDTININWWILFLCMYKTVYMTEFKNSFNNITRCVSRSYTACEYMYIGQQYVAAS